LPHDPSKADTRQESSAVEDRPVKVEIEHYSVEGSRNCLQQDAPAELPTRSKQVPGCWLLVDKVMYSSLEESSF